MSQKIKIGKTSKIDFLLRAFSLYSMVDDPADELKIGPDKTKKINKLGFV